MNSTAYRLARRIWHVVPYGGRKRAREWLRIPPPGQPQTRDSVVRDPATIADESEAGLAFRLMVGRRPNRNERAELRARLVPGLTVDSLAEELAMHAEAQSRFVSFVSRNFDGDVERAAERMLFAAEPWRALHKARLQVISELLPPAEIVVDLGGAHPGDPRGALLAHGYPYRPRELHIVDLPPETRLGGGRDSGDVVSWGGTDIVYHYRSMSDLSPFADASVDLVFSGESIEHVSQEEAEKTFEHVRRILKPGGWFVLDTPNRRVTRLHVGDDAFVHPEHKHEYFVDELAAVWDRFGFTPAFVKGLVHMPRSVARGEFLQDELFANPSVNDDAERSYLFAVALRRDGAADSPG